MCGLTGFVSADSQTSDSLRATVRAMCDAIAHRGPDDAGEWIDAQLGVALGFRRLAILDLSPAGHQPMESASGRYVATLNGEIYNFEEIRRTLCDSGAAAHFRGHSDTEVALAAFDAWGVAAAVPQFNGMFAFAVWDRSLRCLHLIRDRVGVKPLYYGISNRTFLYGSELKAMRRHPSFDGAIDRGALHLYLRFMYVPAPHSIYAGISKLMPGTILTFDPERCAITTASYWSTREAAVRGMANRFQGTEEDAALEVERLAGDAVKLRMVADVPLGVLLSGGIDSSLVTALMQAHSRSPVRTFSVGFNEAEYDEAPYARAVAAHLGTEHTELSVTPSTVLDVIPRLPSMYDEPFADSSQIPTYLVASLARRHVTVCLSGDGGDELFGGYNRYFIGQRVFRTMSRVPAPVRSAGGRLLAGVPASGWNRTLALARPLLPRVMRQPHAGQRIQKLGRVLTATDPDALYFELVSHWSNIVIGSVPSPATVDDRTQQPPLDDPVERMMFFDQISYLPDDILAKVDRASMAASLEAREPLLDYRLIELAWTLPLSMKVRDGRGKQVLRRVLRRYVPDRLIERPKMGFGLPLENWLRGPLRGWAESLLDASTIRRQGLLDLKPIQNAWTEHLAGNDHWRYHLWSVLMLQAWLQQQAETVTTH
jgi:asparagine synthase (glutamine-hydrolysing)